MNIFIKNVNEYLRERNIKHNYISMLTGWDKSKVSRILSGSRDITYSEMEALTDALGQEMDFFMGSAEDMKRKKKTREQIACFAGQLEDEDLESAHLLVELFHFYDALTKVEM